MDRWSPALEKRAARRRVRLSAKARGALAGRGGLTNRWRGEGGGGRDRRSRGGGLTKKNSVISAPPVKSDVTTRSGSQNRGGRYFDFKIGPHLPHWGGGGGGGKSARGGGASGSCKARGAAARPALEERAARRRVRLSEKARGAEARPALCKSGRRGGASGS